MSASREPDALDGARVLALGLAGMSLVGALAKGSDAVRLGLVQLAFLAVPLAYARASGLRPLADAGVRSCRMRDLLLTAVASMASLWILKGLHDAQLEVFRHLGAEAWMREEARRIEETVKRARELLGLAGLSLLAVVPPVCEELFFRGLMRRGFARGFSPARALLYTSLLFAVAHGTTVQLLLMTFLGLYFGALAWLTGSLWPSVLAHAINNAAVLVLQLGWGPRVQDFRAPWPILLLSVLVFAGALALLALDRKARDQGLGGGVLPSPEA